MSGPHIPDKYTITLAGGADMDLDNIHIKEIPTVVQRSVELILVSHMDEVLRRALALNDPDSFLARRHEPITPETFVPSPSQPALVAPIS